MSALVAALVAFIIGFVGSMPLAGPISVMVVSRAATGRFGEALKLAIGAAVAEGIYAGLAFWGFATFLARHATAVPISHAVTATILLVVGIHFARWKQKEDDTAEKRSQHGALFVGFTTAILNPTLLLTWSAVTTALYSRQIVTMQGIIAVPFGICAAAGVAGWDLVLVGLLRRYQKQVPKGVVKWVVRGMGFLLIAIALWSAIDLARKFVFGPS